MESLRQNTTETPKIRIFRTLNMSELNVLKQSWQRGEICVIDTRGWKMGDEQIYFLREFNSYFDYLLWNDPCMPTALFGYLHNEIKLIQGDCSHIKRTHVSFDETRFF
jgi:hypothetical protein